MVLPNGSKVILTGLKIRSDLNGRTGNVLLPTSEEEAKMLKLNSRLKVAGSNYSLYLKFGNVLPIVHSEDWNFSDSRKNRLCLKTSIENCNDLRDSTCPNRLVLFLDDLISLETYNLQHFSKDSLSFSQKRFNDDHNIYSFSLDPICHYLTVETYKGKARVYQSFNGKNNHGLSCKSTSYSGPQWLAQVPLPHWPDELKKVHRQFGGNKNLSWTEFKLFIKLLFRIQLEAQAIIDLRDNMVAYKLLEADKIWEIKNRSKDGVSWQFIEQSELLKWSLYLQANPYFVHKNTLLSGDLLIFSSLEYNLDPFSFIVPKTIANPFISSYKQLTGNDVPGVVFTTLVAYSNWQNKFTCNLDQLSKVPVGWTIKTFSLSCS